MKPYPKLWWRIVGGCLLGLLAILTVGMVLVPLVGPWGYTRPAGHWVMTYQLKSAAGLPAADGAVAGAIEVLRRRIDPHGLGCVQLRNIGQGQVEVRAPIPVSLPPSRRRDQRSPRHQRTKVATPRFGRTTSAAGSIESARWSSASPPGLAACR